MNELYETVNRFLEEMRWDSGEREYAVSTEDVLEAEKERNKASTAVAECLKSLPKAEQSLINEYVEALEHCHFKEEQRAYYQGIMDGVQWLGELGLIRRGNNLTKLISKL